jgi:hypothetical protein
MSKQTALSLTCKLAAARSKTHPLSYTPLDKTAVRSLTVRQKFIAALAGDGSTA